MDLTNATTLATAEGMLVTGTQVKAYGVPTASGVTAYVLFYYDGNILPQ
jgi:hypothetical protein